MPTVVCVLGMHRSGTSLITRALNLLGVYLGPESHAMKPREDNPLGFSEHQPLTDLNDEILTMLGGNWHTPPSRAAGWEADPRFDDIKTRARQLLGEDFGSAPLWGWKDPRTCLTLPFWQQLVPSMRYVICVRSPLDVALSLQVRDGFSIAKGSSLWIDHVTAALTYTSGEPRLLVSYDDLIERQEVELNRLAAFIGRPTSPLESESEVRAFTDTTLRHHRTQMLAAIREPQLSFPAKALYLSLLRLNAEHSPLTDPSELTRNYETAVERLSSDAYTAETAHRQLAAEHHRAMDTIHALQTELAARERERDDARSLVGSLHAQLDASTERARAAADDRDRLRDLADRHRAEADHAGQRLAYIETRRGAIRTAIRVALPRRVYLGLRGTYDRLRSGPASTGRSENGH